jgi:cytochrome c oxidase cbb3-type subunit I/II
MANMHFWIALVGILLYTAAMWGAGIMQGLMLSETNPGGATLKYEFLETLQQIKIFYIFRSFGGALFLLGYILCAVNIIMTARSGTATDATADVVLLARGKKDDMRLVEAFRNDPVTHSILGVAFMILWFFLPPHADKAAFVVAILLIVRAVSLFKKNGSDWALFFDRLIENYLPFTVLIFLAAAIGGAVQIIPSLIVNKAMNVEDRLQVVYTPLELCGRDIYVSEGCYNCHSQMIRTLVPDVMRYGPAENQGYSRLGESIYDHPYQWGSKRTGPDLAREGGAFAKDSQILRIGKRDNLWHFNHFMDPRQTSPGSNMPPYPWLFDTKADIKSLPGKIATQVRLGVPWPALTKDEIEQKARDQGMAIADSLVKAGAFLPAQQDLSEDALRNQLAESKVVALIAYMQKVGSYEEVKTPPKKGPRPLDPDSYRHSSKEQTSN